MEDIISKPDPYGTLRVISPEGVLPQPAWKIDNSMEIGPDELLIDVDTLNIDSASFTQLKEETGGDLGLLSERIMQIVAERGKMHNPVTGSGGMLIGTVAEKGALCSHADLNPGDRLATMVSLSLTPLRIDEIIEIRADRDQVIIKGKAVLFDSGIYAKLPPDIEDRLSLAVLDVAGAPAQTARLVKAGDLVLVIGGGGKSGLLCLHQARKAAGAAGRVIALVHGRKGESRVKETGLADDIIVADASKTVETYRKFIGLTGGTLADVVINTVNVPDTEMSSILTARHRGIVYFFSMATSFTKAALGAEGVGKDIDMLIGNGYAENHSETALNVLRENPVLRELFTRLYV